MSERRTFMVKYGAEMRLVMYGAGEWWDVTHWYVPIRHGRPQPKVKPGKSKPAALTRDKTGVVNTTGKAKR